jgi:hypothetical protein
MHVAEIEGVRERGRESRDGRRDGEMEVGTEGRREVRKGGGREGGGGALGGTIKSGQAARDVLTTRKRVCITRARASSWCHEPRTRSFNHESSIRPQVGQHAEIAADVSNGKDCCANPEAHCCADCGDRNSKPCILPPKLIG